MEVSALDGLRAVEIAQACSSTAISSWMHQGIIFNFAGVWRTFAARGRRDDVARIERVLTRVAEGQEAVQQYVGQRDAVPTQELLAADLLVQPLEAVLRDALASVDEIEHCERAS